MQEAGFFLHYIVGWLGLLSADNPFGGIFSVTKRTQVRL